ncbi:YeiH family protein [Arhodomonas sp. AD133]|uniref:YeiH family protein n=1 Tax=Arhodomonas sp. AD133 TaxID=3415009 RepID=UPI003EBD0AEC
MREQTRSLSSLAAVTPAWLPGLVVSGAIAGAAVVLGQWSVLQRAAVSPLVVAILLGVLATNVLGRALATLPGQGFALARGPLLRLAIIVYGLRVPLAQMEAVGGGALLVSVSMVATTLAFAWFVGRRWLGLDDESALLIGAGSAICGAAAVLATEGVVGSRPGKVGVAVATVVVFGSAAMLVYPVLLPWLADTLGLGWGATTMGVYTGATVHEVAQVVVAGAALGPNVLQAALVTKMMRVCLLVPVLFALVWLLRRRNGTGERRIALPWFALAFLAAIVVQPWLGLTGMQAQAIAQGDDLMLATAMAALGLTVRWSTVRAAGARPLILGALLFVHLIGTGLLVSWLVLS